MREESRASLGGDDAVRGVGEVEVLESREGRPEVRVHGLQGPALGAGQAHQGGQRLEGVPVNARQVDGADVQLLQSRSAQEVVCPYFSEVSLQVENLETLHAGEALLVQVEWREAQVEDAVLEGQVEVTY